MRKELPRANLGYRAGRRFGAASDAIIKTIFDRFAAVYRRDVATGNHQRDGCRLAIAGWLPTLRTTRSPSRSVPTEPASQHFTEGSGYGLRCHRPGLRVNGGVLVPASLR